MSVTQTVEIPANHRLTIEVPREVPVGKARITLTSETEVSGDGFRIPLVSWFQKRREERFRRAVIGVTGCLANNPAFKGNAVEIQRRMRAEWDRPWDTDEKESRL
ncbi:hypothetical protein AGMMS50293_30480 [Spirochaetia bacterium]|nr:hypothetical protein AGMMS50293_30480 [Spirochaetia bacterium]